MNEEAGGGRGGNLNDADAVDPDGFSSQSDNAASDSSEVVDAVLAAATAAAPGGEAVQEGDISL
eukprot:CAMPEP_0184405636 /NCGR_PEP_ID=MMETSP0738-20130409/870_1 /TAXON_ID=385413 /ORGANISM="Thalassiosira miniscula, Strain CCMP1093" /LENGTH=63 /DNA_ID=CAMNT_0026762193 /DNA_START=79 /DNA_END=271 /DNA_ORIENTATION=-